MCWGQRLPVCVLRHTEASTVPSMWVFRWPKSECTTLQISTLTHEKIFGLMSNQHVVDNLGKPAGNKDVLYNMHHHHDCMRKLCLTFQLEADLCIDALTVPFTGIFPAKNYTRGNTGWHFFFLLSSTTELSEIIIKNGIRSLQIICLFNRAVF